MKNILQKTIVLLLLYIMFFGLLIQETTHIPYIRLIFGLSILPILFILLLFYNQSFERYQILLSFFVLSVLPISYIIWNNVYAINLYIAVITATIIYNTEKEFFKNLLIFVLIVQVCLQIYEFETSHYIYDYVLKKGDIEFNMSLENLSFFRGKGLFPGALTAGSFAIYMAFIFRNNPYILVLALSSAILASTRLSILTIFIIIFLFIFQNNSIKRTSKIYFIIIIFSLIFIMMSIYSSEFIDRLSNVTDITSDTNSLRIYYWMSGIKEFFKYDYLNIIFGNSNYFASIYGNSAESDWIMLLLETGFIGFLLYLFPILYLLIQYLRKNKFLTVMILLLWCIDIFLYRHISGIASNVLHWFLLFLFIDELKQKKVKNEKSINP